jgi:serine/threonine-protein kinase
MTAQPEGNPARLESVRDIASGRFGIVRQMRNPRTHQNYAVKFCHAPRTRGDFAAFKETLPLFASVCHPCVVPLKSIIASRDGSGPTVTMEYVPNGSLADVLLSVERGQPPVYWTHTQIAIIVAGIAFGIKHLHICGIVHGIWKPSHIFSDQNYQPRISDYVTWTMERTRIVKLSQVGSPTYIAPEMYDCKRVPSGGVDVFAFGLILYELVVGEKAFPLSLSTGVVMKRMIMGQRPSIPQTVNPNVSHLITPCWAPQPENRPSS